MVEGRSVFKILIYKPTGQKPLGRSKRRWEDNIRVDVKEILVDAMDYVNFIRDMDYWTKMNLWVL